MEPLSYQVIFAYSPTSGSKRCLEKEAATSSLSELRVYEGFAELHKDLVDRAISYCLPLLVQKPYLGKLWGKDSYQQRDVGFFAIDPAKVTGYSYSKQTMAANPCDESMRQLIEVVNRSIAGGNGSYNAILVNRYLDGDNYISAHSDDEHGLDSENGVVMISVGAGRRFQLLDRKNNKVFEFRTENYQLAQMAGPDFQKQLKHAVPKEKRIREERISFTFRKHVEL